MRCLIAVITLFFVGPTLFAQEAAPGPFVWQLGTPELLDDDQLSILGEPKVIDSPVGKALYFDGEDDALVFGRNPVSGWSTFTLEVIFRPDPGGSREQRFVHLQQVDEHRILIETRLTPDGRWFLDTFLKSGESECTLYAKEFLHPLGSWFHAALSYENGTMSHYVNGIKEMECEVEFEQMSGGQTSVGVRLNRVYWFKGAIQEIGATPRALKPPEFLLKSDF